MRQLVARLPSGVRALRQDLRDRRGWSSYPVGCRKRRSPRVSREPRADPTGVVGVLAAATGVQERVVILAVADYAQHEENASWVAKMHQAFSQSMPGWTVSVRAVYGAFEDDAGLFAHVDGATGKLKGERQIKRARVDLLTSCAKVLRAMGTCRTSW